MAVVLSITTVRGSGKLA